ncbi:DUF6350 family protein [Solicola sp. PLA-1-18]|uniref:cell division protein PerM n=1 Tax=Solicola sp. PLA-1-18 TaxID=3380532 RepID=UPI003B81564D
MTDTLARGSAARPGSRGPAAPGPARPVALTAVLAALGAAGAGTVVAVALAVVAWLGGSAGGIGDAVRAGAAGWLVGHGSGLSVGAVTVGAIPLGLTALLLGTVVLVTRVAVVPSRLDSIRGLAELATVGAVTYAAWACVLVLVAGGSGAEPDLVRAGIGSFLLAFVGLAWGGARGSGLDRTWWDLAPASVRSGLVGAGVALATLLLASTVLYVVALLRGLGAAGRLWGSLDAGVVGGIALALLCLLVLPNLVLWSTSVLLGPGFALGTGTAVSLTGSDLGAVPGLPVLAAVPAPAVFPGWALALAAVPVLAGALGGWWGTRRLEHGPWTHAVAVGSAGGAGAGVVVALLLAVSGGPVGPGRMADVGPFWLACSALAVLTLAVGGAIGAAAGHYRGAGAQDPPARD